MRKLAIAMALASTALATPAVARDQTWYAGVEGGAMLVEDTQFDYKDSLINVNDAVVLDYRLPDSNDLGLLTAIRRLTPGVPVIMMTAHGTTEMVTGALDLGAYTVVNKPFEVQHVVDLVTASLAAR